MPYIQTQQPMGGLVDGLKSLVGGAVDLMKAGLQPQQQQQTPVVYQPPPQQSFMDKYGTVVLLGGAGLAAYLIIQKRRKG